MFYRRREQKFKSYLYFVEIVDVNKFASNPDKYPSLTLADKKSEKQESIFQAIVDLIRLEYFFKSEWCNSLCDLEGDMILGQLKRKLHKTRTKNMLHNEERMKVGSTPT